MCASAQVVVAASVLPSTPAWESVLALEWQSGLIQGIRRLRGEKQGQQEPGRRNEGISWINASTPLRPGFEETEGRPPGAPLSLRSMSRIPRGQSSEVSSLCPRYIPNPRMMKQREPNESIPLSILRITMGSIPGAC